MVIKLALKNSIHLSIIKDLNCVFPGSVIELKSKSLLINTKTNSVFGKAFSSKRKNDIIFLKSNLPETYLDNILIKLERVFKDRPSPIRRIVISNNEINFWVKLKANWAKFKNYTYNLEKSLWVF